MASVNTFECDVLLVDDEAGVRQLLNMILSDDGFTIRSAANGTEAFALLQSGCRPRLILLDLMMPGMNGWEFIAAIKKDEALKDIPVVLITAYSRGNLPLPELQILEKPFDIPLLLEIVSKHCRGGKSQFVCYG